MKVYIKNLYGIKEGRKSYFKRWGTYCYQFVLKKELASDLTSEEIADLMRQKEAYLKLYNADSMGIED